jgi:cyclophilin family peptidyl-prolyl cis-trans isomerase
MKKKILFLLCILMFSVCLFAQSDVKLKKKDRRRDIEMTTTKGTIILRLNDSTPLHRDNFLRLVKSHYYDGILFHRVIKNFMIQGGDPESKTAKAGQPLGNGGPDYTVPAEFRTTLFHKKGVLAAARSGDNVNPEKKSSGSQFYIVQGKKFTDGALDTLERVRRNGRKLPEAHREVYKTIGGTPHLDGNYTVYGEVVKGLEVVDAIAEVQTSKNPADRPEEDVKIIRAKLIKRKRY